MYIWYNKTIQIDAKLVDSRHFFLNCDDFLKSKFPSPKIKQKLWHRWIQKVMSLFIQKIGMSRSLNEKMKKNSKNWLFLRKRWLKSRLLQRHWFSRWLFLLKKPIRTMTYIFFFSRKTKTHIEMIYLISSDFAVCILNLLWKLFMQNWK